MLGILFTVLSTYALAKWRNFDLNLYNITRQKNVMFLIVIVTIVFWILHAVLSKNKDVKRYTEHWEDDGIRFFRGTCVITYGLIYLTICTNLNNGVSIFHNIWIYCVAAVVFNVIQIILIDHVYSHNLRELIVDTVLLQIQDCRNTLLLILTVLCMLSWTIVGALFLLCFFAIIFKW